MIEIIIKRAIIKRVLILSLFSFSLISADNFRYSRNVVPVSNGYSNAGLLNNVVKFIADQLSKNKDFANISKSKLAITSFVSIEDLKKTNKLGNLISEHLIHDMQIRGFQVVDFKTMPSIEVGLKGDYIFSRSIDDLKKDISLNYILTGTYSHYSDGVTLNARIIDLKTNIVVSSAQAYIPKSSLRHIMDKYTSYDRVAYKPDYVLPSVEDHTITIKEANW